MLTDSRALAWWHMWLSWWWGVGLMVAISLLWGLTTAIKKLFQPEPRISFTVAAWASVLALQFLSVTVPALLRALARQPLMRHIFNSANSWKRLLLRTALVVEGFVLLCWLLWELLVIFIDPQLFQVMPLQHLWSTTLAFFGLSLPWLLSSLAAAWWVWRPGRTPQADAAGSQALAQNL